MTLYHITSWSIDKQDILIPRIPDKTGIDEDFSHERISLAPSIKKCIMGIGDNNLFDEDNRIRVYTVKINRGDPYVVDWERLYNSGMVNDAPLTHEHWYKKEIRPIRYAEYLVCDTVTDKLFVTKAGERNRIVDIIKKNGIDIPRRVMNMSAVEILNYYRNDYIIATIKESLVHVESDDDCKYLDVFKQCWGDVDFSEEMPDYAEHKYIVDCHLVRME